MKLWEFLCLGILSIAGAQEALVLEKENLELPFRVKKKQAQWILRSNIFGPCFIKIVAKDQDLKLTNATLIHIESGEEARRLFLSTRYEKSSYATYYRDCDLEVEEDYLLTLHILKDQRGTINVYGPAKIHFENHNRTIKNANLVVRLFSDYYEKSITMPVEKNPTQAKKYTVPCGSHWVDLFDDANEDRRIDPGEKLSWWVKGKRVTKLELGFGEVKKIVFQDLRGDEKNE